MREVMKSTRRWDAHAGLSRSAMHAVVVRSRTARCASTSSRAVVIRKQVLNTPAARWPVRHRRDAADATPSEAGASRRVSACDQTRRPLPQLAAKQLCYACIPSPSRPVAYRGNQLSRGGGRNSAFVFVIWWTQTRKRPEPSRQIVSTRYQHSCGTDPC